MPNLPLRPGADDDEWESLLRQLRARPAQPRPFFYGRVRARLVRGAAARPLLPAWLRWPSYALMLGIILLLSGDGAVLRSGGPGRPYQLDPAARPAGLPAR